MIIDKTVHPMSERGQALVIIVVAMFGLIGMTALTIDGGRAYSDQRRAQNAADTAALAASLAQIHNQADWATISLNRAASNGYDNNGTTNIVNVYAPPIDGVYAGDNEYVQVVITSHLDTMFGGVIGVHQVTNTVQAVARAAPSVNEEMFNGEAIVGLSPHDCKAVKYQGNANTTVTGGGIFVNSDCSSSAFFNQSASAQLTAPSLRAVGGITYKPGSINIPLIDTGAEALGYPPRDLTLPNISCSGAASVNGNQMSPGSWNGTFPPNKNVDTLLSGVYCVESGNFKVNANTTLIGHDVVIVIETGSVTWNGNATINLDAPDSGPYKGLLMYLPITNTSTVKINGSSSSTYTGTILAPGADITIKGSGAVDGFNSQVIGYTVELTGNSDTKIIYSDGDNWDAPTPPSIELMQ